MKVSKAMLSCPPMNDVDRFLSEARKLSAEARNELTDRILELVPDQIDPAIDEAWRAELHRRQDKIRSGDTELVSGEDIRAKLLSK